FLGWRVSCYRRCERCLRERARQSPLDAACARNAGCVANDFRSCAVVIAWVRCRWKPGAFSLDFDGRVLLDLSGCDRLGTDLSASLLAATAPDCGAVAKHLSDYSTGSGYARLVARGRNISALVPVRRCTGPCWRMDDFPKNGSSGTSNSGRLARCHRCLPHADAE